MWAVARACQISFKPIAKSSVPVLRNPVAITTIDFINSASSARHQALRRLTNTRSGRISHVLRRSKESHPETAFSIGQGVAAGAGVAGLGALCYYGLGLSNKEGIAEKAVLWPKYVQDRIKTTYMYVGGSIAVAVAAATATLRSPAMMRIFASGGIAANLLLFGSLVGSSMIVQSIPYTPGFGMKQISWLTFASLVGGMMAPLSFFGGQVIIRAAWYTAGIVGGLSIVSMCAPSEQFLMMGGPLAIGSGFVLASGIGAMFLPPTNMVGAGLHAMFLYGGLVLFSVMLLYNNQKIVKKAETIPPDHFGGHQYDPINMSMSVFMDIVNIFMRMVIILGGSSKNR